MVEYLKIPMVRFTEALPKISYFLNGKFPMKNSTWKENRKVELGKSQHGNFFYLKNASNHFYFIIELRNWCLHSKKWFDCIEI